MKQKFGLVFSKGCLNSQRFTQVAQYINDSFLLILHLPSIPATGRQRQGYLCEFKASQTYAEKSCLEKPKRNKKETAFQND